MSPVVLGGIAAAAAGVLLVGVGIVAAEPTVRLLTRRLARAHRDLHRYRRRLARYERDLARAEAEVRDLTEAVEELREGVGRVWDQAFKAGRETDEWALITRDAERRQCEYGGGRS